MQLIIVESPTKAKTLSRFLGKDFVIEASMGHVMDLPQSTLGIDLEKDFEPKYVISEGKKEKVAQLQKEAGKASNVILATDPDREGEAIAWHLASLLKVKKLERITFHEITESAIKEALSHPGQLNMDMVDAQQARRVLDRLVGYKLSPLLWRKVRRGLSAGRVQSVAVRLIVEREREVKAFVPVEYWEIAAQLSSHDQPFLAKLVKTEINKKEDSDKIVEVLKASQFKVTDVTKKEVRRNPYPPFTTSTLQQSASNVFGWSAKKTMQIAQKLYEIGLISYHRTDSTNLAAEAVSAVREFVAGQYGQQYLPGAPKAYQTKSKVAQEAHEAIRPTNVNNKEGGDEQLDRDQKRLYELIWKRFVACQMAEAVYQQIAADISADKYLLRANGSKVLFDGWKKLYAQAEIAENSEVKEEVENSLPELTTDEVLTLLGITPSQHFTEPPPRYTEASLIKILEEYGIGRPSTYAPIISTILERNYVEKADRKLQPTVLGNAVTDFLTANFPTVMDYKFTAGMEDSLDEIANGQKKWKPVIAEFYTPFEQILKSVGENAQRVKIETEETNEVCPLDGSPLVIRIGKFGRFLACSKFPDCKFTKAYVQKLDIKCPKCGGDIILRKTRSKKTFYGCSNYPKCDFASWTKPKVETGEKNES